MPGVYGEQGGLVMGSITSSRKNFVAYIKTLLHVTRRGYNVQVLNQKKTKKIDLSRP
jgi:predicted RNA-binding protein with RPS1 domain